MKKNNKVWFQISAILLWVLVVYLGRYGLAHYEFGERNIKLFKAIMIDFCLYGATFVVSNDFYHRFISSAVIWNTNFSISMFSIILLVPVIFIGQYGSTHVFYEGLLSLADVYLVDTILCLMFTKSYENI